MTTTTKTPNTRNLAIIVSLTAATVGVVYGYDTGSPRAGAPSPPMLPSTVKKKREMRSRQQEERGAA